MSDDRSTPVVRAAQAVADRSCEVLGLEPVTVMLPRESGGNGAFDPVLRTLRLNKLSTSGRSEMTAQVFRDLVCEAFPDDGNASRTLVAAACLGLGLFGYAAGWVRGLVSGHGSWVSGAVLPVGYVGVMALFAYRRYLLVEGANRRRAEIMRLAGEDTAVIAAYARLCPSLPDKRRKKG